MTKYGMSNLIDIKKEVKKLREDGLTLLDTIEKEARSFTPEEQTKWDEIDSQISKHQETIDRIEKREKLTLNDFDRSNHKPVAPEKRNASNLAQAFRGFIKHSAMGVDPEKMTISKEEREACETWGINHATREFGVKGEKYGLMRIPGFTPEKRTLTEGTWTLTGGGPLFTYQNIADQIDVALKAYGQLLNTSTVFQTATAFPLPLPTVNDTTVSGAWVAESGAITPLDLGATATVLFKGYKLCTGIKFSWEILNDAGAGQFPLEAWLATQLGIRLSRGLENAFMNGSGSGQPTGLAEVVPNSGISTGGTTSNPSVDFDHIIRLINSIDPGYLNNPSGLGFIMHQETFSIMLRKKDSANRYLWIEGGTTGSLGQPFLATLFGYPVYINNQCPKPSTGASGDPFIMFGKLDKYHVRAINTFQFQRLNELYALNGECALLAWGRYDGNLVDAGTNPIQAIMLP